MPPRRDEVSKLGFVLWAALGLLIAEASAFAQVHKIGFLSPAPEASMTHRLDALRDGLRELGYVDGQNINIEYRLGGRETMPNPVPRMESRLSGSYLGSAPAGATRPVVDVQSVLCLNRSFTSSTCPEGKRSRGIL